LVAFLDKPLEVGCLELLLEEEVGLARDPPGAEDLSDLALVIRLSTGPGLFGLGSLLVFSFANDDLLLSLITLSCCPETLGEAFPDPAGVCELDPAGEVVPWVSDPEGVLDPSLALMLFNASLRGMVAVGLAQEGRGRRKGW
jgi:hypothetical protein